MHSIADKAEIAVDFPEKLYRGEFGRNSSFDACTEADGVLIKLHRQGGEKRDAQIHLNYLLFADIIAEIARAVREGAVIDDLHRQPLVAASRDLAAALAPPRATTPAS